MSLATETRSLYRQYLKELVSIRRIRDTGTGRTDESYATVGRMNASNNAARKELVGGIAQQDLTAIIYSQDLFDNGMPSDVELGDILIDQDGIEHSVEEVQARRVEGVLVAYELTVRA